MVSNLPNHIRFLRQIKVLIKHSNTIIVLNILCKTNFVTLLTIPGLQLIDMSQ